MTNFQQIGFFIGYGIGFLLGLCVLNQRPDTVPMAAATYIQLFCLGAAGIGWVLAYLNEET